MVKWVLKNKWLLAILLVAIFLRVYRLDYLELFGDEVDAGYQAYSLLKTGADYKGNFLPTYIHSFSEWRAPGLMYAMVPFIKIFGLNEWGVRLTAAFFGIMAIGAFYWLLAELKIDIKVKLWSVGLLAIIPWQVQYSRAGYELTLMSAMLIWGTIFLIKAKKSSWWLVACGLSYSVGIYTYNTANVLVPFLVLLVALVYRIEWKKLGKLLLVGVIFCTPMLMNIFFGSAANRFKLFSVWDSKEVNEEIINLRNENSNKFSKIFYNKLIISTKKIIYNYSNAFSSNFLFNFGDVTFRQSLHEVGNLYWTMMPLILWSLVNFIKNRKTTADKLMLGLMLVAPIPAALTIDGFNHASRLFLLSFPLVYWAAKGAANLNKVWVVLVAILIVGEFSFYQFYFWNNYRIESVRWWQTGYKELISDVNKYKNNYQRVMIDNDFEPGLIRYLFWNKINPLLVAKIDDSPNTRIDENFRGFKLPNEEMYFVNFNGQLKIDWLKNKTLYVFSQEKNFVKGQDLTKDKLDGIEIVDTVRDYQGKPIFYLLSKR